MVVNYYWKKKVIFRGKLGNNKLYIIWLDIYGIGYMVIYSVDLGWEVINYIKFFLVLLLEFDSNFEYIF